MLFIAQTHWLEDYWHGHPVEICQVANLVRWQKLTVYSWLRCIFWTWSTIPDSSETERGKRVKLEGNVRSLDWNILLFPSLSPQTTCHGLPAHRVYQIFWWGTPSRTPLCLFLKQRYLSRTGNSKQIKSQTPNSQVGPVKPTRKKFKFTFSLDSNWRRLFLQRTVWTILYSAKPTTVQKICTVQSQFARSALPSFLKLFFKTKYGRTISCLRFMQCYITAIHLWIFFWLSWTIDVDNDNKDESNLI